MSHHCVLVIHNPDQNLFEMLEPYSANHKVEPRKICTREEALKTIKENCNPFPEDTDEDILNWYLTVFPHFILKDGWLCCTENPNAKWREWEIGGKYDDILLNGSGFCNSDKLSNIEWVRPLTTSEKDELREWWDYCVSNRDTEEAASVNYEIYKTFDNLVRCMETTYFSEVLAPDGFWYDMNSFGCDGVEWAKEFYDNFIRGKDPDLIATVVDCTY